MRSFGTGRIGVSSGMHTQPVRGFYYVDLFAGPGKDRIEESGKIILGSPLMALEQRFPYTNYHFVEIQPPHIFPSILDSDRLTQSSWFTHLPYGEFTSLESPFAEPQ